MNSLDLVLSVVMALICTGAVYVLLWKVFDIGGDCDD